MTSYIKMDNKIVYSICMLIRIKLLVDVKPQDKRAHMHG